MNYTPMLVFGALADPIRSEIVQLLARREMTAGEIADRFPVSRPSISRHLKVLRDAGLARARGDAQRRIYSLNPAPLAEMERWLNKCHRFWTRKLDQLERRLEIQAKEKR